MKYVSTRGAAPVLDFADVLLAGLAADGGLYVPETWPALPPGWDAPRPYAALATDVLWPYVEGSPVPRLLERRTGAGKASQAAYVAA